MDKNVSQGGTLEIKAQSLKLIPEIMGSDVIRRGRLLCKIQIAAVWELQIILGTFDYTLAFVVVMFKIGMCNEDNDGILGNIICGSTKDSYHVPIIYDTPLKGTLTNNNFLACKIRYFKYGSRLQISDYVYHKWRE